MSNESAQDRLHRITGAFQECKILLAAAELGIFDRLRDGPADAATLAPAVRGTLRGVTILCDALVGLGYLTKRDGRYANTDEASRYLAADGADSLAHILRHRNHMFRSWAALEDVVRSGPTATESDKDTLWEPEANRNFILAMAEVSRDRTREVLDVLPLAGARHFVDLGGGPGHYACEAARLYPELRATLVDLPLTVEVAREYIAGQGLAERVRTQVCNFYAEDELNIGGPADVVLISQVFHAEGSRENVALLRKLHPHVAPGGVVAVSENLVEPGRTSPVPATVFAVNMLVGTERGSTYTADEISEWLSAAGFSPQPVQHVAPRTGVIIGRRAT